MHADDVAQQNLLANSAPQSISMERIDSLASVMPQKGGPGHGTFQPHVTSMTDAEATLWANQWWSRHQDQNTDLRFGKDSLYFLPEPLLALLESQDGKLAPVRLLKGSWLLARADMISHADIQQREILRLPRRQDLPGDAFLSVEDVRSLVRGHAGEVSKVVVHCQMNQ